MIDLEEWDNSKWVMGYNFEQFGRCQISVKMQRYITNTTTSSCNKNLGRYYVMDNCAKSVKVRSIGGYIYINRGLFLTVIIFTNGRFLQLASSLCHVFLKSWYGT